jgi:hypothetical protein
MAVVNTKSSAISNADASPAVLNSPRVVGGFLRESVGTVEVAAGDDDGSVFRFVRVPSNARISTVEYANDAITAGTDYDLGVYDTADAGGAVVSVNLFGDALDLSSAHAFTDATYETTATNISKVDQELWQLLGLTSDPSKDYDICATGVTVGSAAGTISLRVRYAA